MKILLTGGNGFIGKTILESEWAKQHCIDAPRSFELDLRDTVAVDTFMAHRTYDALIHSAVKPGHRNAADPTALLQSNLRINENLLRHAHRFGRLINLGSGAIYDTSRFITLANETQVFERIPTDEHGFCKVVQAKRWLETPNAINLHLFGVYGPHEDWQIRFISNAVCKALHGLPITLRQNRRFSYLYAPDLIPVLDALLSADTVDHAHYNVVPPHIDELAQLATLVQQQVQPFDASLPLPAVHIANEGYGLDYTGDASRLLHEFPQLRFTSVQNALASLFAYYRHHSDVTREALSTDK
ncbi:MAG: NAD-dependent epimerase/dehydratase family protein [Vampirovibrionales bacterium]